MEHGKEHTAGWASLDDLSLERKQCSYLPKDAMPPTSAPTESTPQPDEWFCSFQDDLCNFEVEGDEEFKFRRTSGSEVEAIGVDHAENADGKFLYAQADGNTPPATDVFTYVISDEFDGKKHDIECFHFWFYLDGFLV